MTSFYRPETVNQPKTVREKVPYCFASPMAQTVVS